MNAEIKSGKLIDKVAIVTGAGSGIGAAIARLFAKEGARVVVAELNEETAKKTAKEIEQGGGQAVAAKVDVSCKEEVDKVVRDALAHWGKIDILINNAGVPDLNWFMFMESGEKTWDRIIAVNLKGTLLFTHAVLPSMAEQKYGKIVNISSTAGKLGQATQAVYSATKGGICAFSKALAKEVARYQITVNDICPGPIDTPMSRLGGDIDPKGWASYLKSTPLRRVGEPEEIAAAALFLASGDADFITSHSLVVDGGFTSI